MDPLEGCRDPGEGGKVLGVFLPQLLHHSKGIKKHTLTSLNTRIISAVNLTYDVDQLIGSLIPRLSHHPVLDHYSTKTTSAVF